MDTSEFQPARLIPITGIKGDQEQELRATSALLAVLSAVPEFGVCLVSRFQQAPEPFNSIISFRSSAASS